MTLIEDQAVLRTGRYGDYIITQLKSRRILLQKGETPIKPVKPILREICKKVGVGTQRENGRAHSTQRLGHLLLKHIELQAEPSASKTGKNENKNTIIYPDDVAGKALQEGSVKSVLVNAYERNTKARRECIEHYGARCCVCGFDFSATYGDELGSGFIHVHHLIDLASIKGQYTVDPKEDLRPLCPNCHAMVHKEKPSIRPEELKAILKELAQQS